MPSLATSAADRFSSIKKAATDLGIAIDQRGAGRAVVLLHGGAGPNSVLPFAERLSGSYHVITPTHPGFGGTERAEDISSVKDLAGLYSDLLTRAGLSEVLLVGFSIGGWIAAETALVDQALIAGLVLADAVGITVPEQDVLDVFSISPSQIADFSYHRPQAFRIDLSKLTEQQAAGFKANFAALAVYGKAQNMQDPDLGQRLARVTRPALVLWGESDRVVSREYGEAFAEAIPNSRFELIAECGHLPQIEQADITLELVREFEQSLPV
jgi:pimeloyl-ACP methyl ester carboxylesterase